MFQSHLATIHAVKFDSDVNGPVEFKTNEGTFAIARKDFFAAFDHDWVSELTPGTQLRVWTLAGEPRLAGLEVLRPVENAWYAVWFAGNRFDTKEESERKMQMYIDLIREESAKVAQMIDEGQPFEVIKDAMSERHTLNTVAMAFTKGLKDAKNRENASRVQQELEDLYGGRGTVVKP